MSKPESKLNRIFVDLEAAYIKKAKYVKIINTMKHSNIPYYKSIQMDHPIYSLKQAEYEVKHWENVYHNKIVKHIEFFTLGKIKNNRKISLHALTRKDLIDIVTNNLKHVQLARRHYVYVQNIYKDYKTRLEDINNKIKELKQEIVTAITSEVPQDKHPIEESDSPTPSHKSKICTDENNIVSQEVDFSSLTRQINDGYEDLAYKYNASRTIRANPEDCEIVLLNNNTGTHTTGQNYTTGQNDTPTAEVPVFQTERPNTDIYNNSVEIREDGSGFVVAPDCGPTSTKEGFVFDPNTGAVEF